MKRKLSLLLLLPTLLLTSCEKAISQEEFTTKLNDVNQALNIDNPKLDNINIHSRLNINRYNYKVGEYYSYHMFVLALIIPVNEEDHTWKDGDKYYHYSAEPFKSGVKKEIDKNQFDEYMRQGRQKILNLLKTPYNKNLELMSEECPLDNPKYTFSEDGSKLTFKCEGTTVTNSETNETSKTTIKITYKDSLPTVYYTKSGDSKEEWKYTYGSSSFTPPSDNQNQ